MTILLPSSGVIAESTLLPTTPLSPLFLSVRAMVSLMSHAILGI